MSASTSRHFVEHLTGPCDRWDTLSSLYYGDTLAYEVIRAANPALASHAVLPPGVRVEVPVEVAPATPPRQLASGLPAWLR